MKSLTTLLRFLRRSSESDVSSWLDSLLAAFSSLNLVVIVRKRFAAEMKVVQAKISIQVIETTEFVDPLVNADLYEQLQETKPPPKVDLALEAYDKLAVDENASTENYIAAFLGKTFLLTGISNFVKTDHQSKDSMKILALRVLNVMCSRLPLEKFVVRIGRQI